MCGEANLADKLTFEALEAEQAAHLTGVLHVIGWVVQPLRLVRCHILLDGEVVQVAEVFDVVAFVLREFKE